MKCLVIIIFLSCLITTNLLADDLTSTTWHKMTSQELEKLKNIEGVYEEGKNYNVIIDGYGTGLVPPTEENWEKIAKMWRVVDKVELINKSYYKSNIDHSTSQYFPPIGDQDDKNSCTCWVVGYYYKTFLEAKEHNWDLSDAIWYDYPLGCPDSTYQDKIFTPDFIYHQISKGVDSGSWYYDAFSIAANIGCATWDLMPYNPNDYITFPSETAFHKAAPYRNSNPDPYEYSAYYLSINDSTHINTMKNVLLDNNLLLIEVEAGSIDEMTTLDDYPPSLTNHAQTIIGFDDNWEYQEEGETHYGAFKVANSWGLTWNGETNNDGCYWISYEVMKQCIPFCLWTDDIIDYTPTMSAVFKINHNKRDDCKITLGIGTPDSPLAIKQYDYKTGPHPFPNNRIVIDISEFASYMDSGIDNFFIKVYDDPESDITGTISYFAIEVYDDYNSGIPTEIWTSYEIPLNTINGDSVNVQIQEGSGINVISVPSDYNTIQEALNACNSNYKVMVAPDIYYENIIWPDIANIKLLSEEGSTKTIIDANNNGCVIYIDGSIANIDTSTYIKGFTIQNGGLIDINGAGIYLNNASPQIIDNTITNNSTNNDGGGIYCYNSSPEINNNIIIQNSANKGAGIFCHNSSSIIKNNTIINNLANQGGGIYRFDNSYYPILSSNINFTNNIYHNTPDNFYNNGASSIEAEYNYWGNFVNDEIEQTFAGNGANFINYSPTSFNPKEIKQYVSTVGDILHFAELTLSIDTINGADIVQVSTYIDSLPSNADSTNFINKFWNIETGNAITRLRGNLTFYYDDSELNDNSAYLVIIKYWTGTDWKAYDTLCDTINNTLSCEFDKMYGLDGIWTLSNVNIINIPEDYTNIQEALDVADEGNAILVSAGIYYENIVWPKTNCIKLISKEGVNNTIIDGGNNGNVIYIDGLDVNIGVSTWVDGFTIQNGKLIENYEYGAGIYIANASPIINNNIISNNSTFLYGGGIYCYRSSPIIKNNIITNNLADSNGAGIACYEFSYPIIENNIIKSNSSGIDGGGISSYISSSPQIIDNTIIENSANYFGGGISFSNCSAIINNNLIVQNSTDYAGGGIYCFNSSIEISNNTIINNLSNYGAGIYRDDNNSNLYLGTNINSINNIYHNYSYLTNIFDNYYNNDNSYVDASYNYWGNFTSNEISQTFAGNGAELVNYLPISILPTEISHINTSNNDTLYFADLKLIINNITGIDTIRVKTHIDTLPIWKTDTSFVNKFWYIEVDTNIIELSGELLFYYDNSEISSNIENRLNILARWYGEQWYYYSINTLDTLNNYISHTFLELNDLEGIWLLGYEDVGVFDEENNMSIITQYTIKQNYPNPFNPETHIKFGLPEAGFVKLKVYNVIGQLVKTLTNEHKEAGYHTITWQGDSEDDVILPSGVYIYRLEIDGAFRETKSMVMLK